MARNGGGGAGTARDVLELMAHDRMLPGNNVVIWGNTSYAQRAADALEALGAAVTRLGNDARIEGVLVERDGAEQIIACDALVISHDLPPWNSWPTAKLKPTCPSASTSARARPRRRLTPRLTP